MTTTLMTADDQSGVHQVSSVDSNSDVDEVVDQIRAVSLLQSRVWDERRTAAGDVHRRPRLLVAGAGRIRSERVLDVSTVVPLVKQRQSDALAERPRQQFIVITLRPDSGHRSMVINNTDVRHSSVVL